MGRKNLCKKIPGKKVSEKNLEIKTLEKKSEFSQVLGKNVTGNKVLGLFYFNSMEAVNKVSQEIRSQETR